MPGCLSAPFWFPEPDMAAKPPHIAHWDGDAFFVSVEQAENPALRGLPVAVGGGDRGIIASASYEARALGIKTPMPTAQARKMCPSLIIVPGTRGLYSRYSRRIFEMCEELTPMVEKASIDEGYLDLTGTPSLADSAAAMRKLQARVAAELKVTLSVGLASNKLASALASKLRKPRGFTVIEPGGEAAFFAPLELSRLPGVGPRFAEDLKSMGLNTCAELLARDPAALARVLGAARLEALRLAAQGLDHEPVVTEHGPAVSRSSQKTFEQDSADRSWLLAQAREMLTELLLDTRDEGRRAGTLTVKIRQADWHESSAATTLPEPSELDDDFLPHLDPLLRRAWNGRSPLRLISVRLSNLSQGSRQLGLFDDGKDRKRQLLKATDALNRALGGGAVKRGILLGPNSHPGHGK